MGLLSLGCLVSERSPFGRFRQQKRTSSFSQRLLRCLRCATDSLRAARGASSHQFHRKNVLKLTCKCHRARLEKGLQTQKRAGKPQPTAVLHSWVKEALAQSASSSRIITVGDAVLSDDDEIYLWTPFLQTQTSWEGQIEPPALHEGRAQWNFNKPSMPASAKMQMTRAKALLKSAGEQSGAWIENQMSWVEFMDMLTELNAKAASPPTEPIPIGLFVFPHEEVHSIFCSIFASCPAGSRRAGIQ